MNDQASDNRGGPASTCEAARRLPNVFPAAAQPDVVRASQKAGIIVTFIPACRRYTEILTDLQDELYLHYLIDACHDAVRRLLGPRRALLWNRHASAAFSAPSTCFYLAGSWFANFLLPQHRETAVMGQILYYSLTTGAGMQTLGEEYCDILQVTGQSPATTLFVSDSLTALLTVLQVSADQQDVMFLCVHDCIYAKFDGKLSRCPRTSFLNCAPTFLGSVGLPPGTVRRGFLVLLQTMMPYLADQIGTSAERPPTHSASWASRSQLTDQTSAAQPRFASVDEELVHQPSWTVSLDRLMQKIAGRWRSLWQVLSQYSGAAVRLHLALFYFYGLYYHWSKRATGVRYMFIGKLFEHRPSYHLLGVLLFIQLGITSASWAIRNLASLSGNGSKSPEAEPSSSTPRQKERKAVVLEDDSRLAALSPVRLSEGGEVLAYRKCPLCLSMRQQPTATPCGHVFCWQCIAEWGNQKPECPLCRSPFTQSSLVCVHHADF